MSREPILLRGEHLTRSFVGGGRTVPVLRGVSLELGRGEFVLLMGPSGSGKSTLLAVLSGLLRPDAGRVFVHGADLWAQSASRLRQLRQRHFGFVFQANNLFPSLTAREQLEMTARWIDGLGRREARRRAGVMLELLGLAEQGDKFPAELSGGEKQRVAIGRALIKDPAICFADEPTGALDWGSAQVVLERLRASVTGRGATVLIVAHDHRIIPYAHRVLSLEDGYLREADNPQEVSGPP